MCACLTPTKERASWIWNSVQDLTLPSACFRTKIRIREEEEVANSARPAAGKQNGSQQWNFLRKDLFWENKRMTRKQWPTQRLVLFYTHATVSSFHCQMTLTLHPLLCLLSEKILGLTQYRWRGYDLNMLGTGRELRQTWAFLAFNKTFPTTSPWTQYRERARAIRFAGRYSSCQKAKPSNVLILQWSKWAGSL